MYTPALSSSSPSPDVSASRLISRTTTGESGLLSGMYSGNTSDRK